MRIKNESSIIVCKILVLCAVLFSTVFGEKSQYTSVNNQLFISTYASSLNRSDIVFRPDASVTANPAAMAEITENTISTGYTGYFKNTFSVTRAVFMINPKERVGLGISAGYLLIPDIMDTRGLEEDEKGYPVYDPDKISIETSSEIVGKLDLGFTLVQNQNIRLNSGISLHLHRKRLIDWTGYGAGLDAGLIFSLRNKGVFLGVFAQNITTQGIYWSQNYTSYSLPQLNAGLGISREIDYIYGRVSVFFRSDDILGKSGLDIEDNKEETGSNTSDYQSDSLSVEERGVKGFFAESSYGIEYSAAGVAEFRFGFIPSGRISFGGGINLFEKRFSVDFTYFSVRNLPGTYAASMGYSF